MLGIYSKSFDKYCNYPPVHCMPSDGAILKEPVLGAREPVWSVLLSLAEGSPGRF